MSIFPGLTKTFATPLNLITCFTKMLDTLVRRNRPSDFRTYCRCIVEVNQLRKSGFESLSDAHWYFPLRQSFADAPAWNLRTEQDPTFGRRFSPSAALFVARLCGE